MNHYCTLFDTFYLTRGLALYRTLRRHDPESTLSVLCMNDEAFDLLGRLGLPGMKLIRLAEFESPELLAVKSGRTRGEYCWTCTSHLVRYCLDHFELSEVTYLDADLGFFASPGLLLEEFRRSGASSLITEHRYAPQYDQSKTAGIYCVQFMTFRNTEEGRRILYWWQDRCTEWCFARMEDGKFGDQKYLDDWPTRFPGVHVLQHIGGGVAPWNVSRYRVGPGAKVDEQALVFYHFHNFKWYEDGTFDLANSDYLIPNEALQSIYLPYIQEIEASLNAVRAVAPGFTQGMLKRDTSLRSRLRQIKKMLKGTHFVVRP